jgi:hypothetical protein
MRKLLLILVVLVTAFTAKAQTTGAVVTTVPASFTAVDVVEVTIDVSAVPNLAGKEPLYVWTWDPNDPPIGNGDWTNSNEALKLTKVATNKWKWTFVPADFYRKTPAQIPQVQFLVKAKDGSGDAKTSDIKLVVSPLIYVPTAFRSFPSSVSQNDPITFYLDQNLATDVNSQRINPTTAEVKLYTAAGTQVGATKTYTLRNMGNKNYAVTVFPRGDFSIASGVKVNKVTVTYKGTMLDATGTPVNADSQVFEKILDDLK